MARQTTLPVDRDDLTIRSDAVCDWVGINRRTLSRWLSAGLFPKADLNISRVRRWKVGTVRQFIEAQARRRGA